MRKFVAGLIVLAVMVVAGLGVSAKASAAAGDGCDTYAIMRCGAAGPKNFITKANANQAGDLQAIYSDFGLVPADYSRFVDTAQSGTVYADGRIVVAGRTVGHTTLNISRVHDSKFTKKVTIGGQTYWGGSFGSTYHANSAAAMVMFNDKGVMQFAVLSSCGNPQRFTPETPNYSCDQLQKTAVTGKQNTYSFTTKASATNGATLVKAVYDFGDGTSQPVTDLSQPITHTFTKDTHVTVSVYVKLPGGSTVVVKSTDCATDIVFVQPPAPQTPYASCTSLDALSLDATKHNYRFIAYANYGNGVTFTGADFNFGDNTPIVGGVPNGSQVSIDHNYVNAGMYTATATLHFTNANGSAYATAVTCQASVSPETVVSYCKPGVPVGSPDCAAPAALINTGPGEIALGLFGGIGLLAGASHYMLRRKLGL